jgi:lambda repressor-like predicted transcriptional regulator
MVQRRSQLKSARSVREPSRGTAGSAGPRLLVMSVISPDGRLDIDEITSTFGMTRGQLAETVGLAKDTLQKADRREAPKTRARVTEMLEIVSRVESWAGGRPQAMAWYRAQPIAALGGRTAEAMVKSGQAGMVRDYLDQIAVGGFA